MNVTLGALVTSAFVALQSTPAVSHDLDAFFFKRTIGCADKTLQAVDIYCRSTQTHNTGVFFANYAIKRKLPRENTTAIREIDKSQTLTVQIPKAMYQGFGCIAEQLGPDSTCRSAYSTPSAASTSKKNPHRYLYFHKDPYNFSPVKTAASRKTDKRLIEPR